MPTLGTMTEGAGVAPAVEADAGQTLTSRFPLNELRLNELRENLGDRLNGPPQQGQAERHIINLMVACAEGVVVDAMVDALVGEVELTDVEVVIYDLLRRAVAGAAASVLGAFSSPALGMRFAFGGLPVRAHLQHAMDSVSAGDEDAILRLPVSIAAARWWPRGRTLTHLAAQIGRPGSVRALHTLGLALDAEEIDGTTPAHRAALKGHVGCLRVLHELGAAGSLSAYGNFDIILDQTSRFSQRHSTPHALWAVFYLVPRLTGC